MEGRKYGSKEGWVWREGRRREKGWMGGWLVGWMDGLRERGEIERERERERGGREAGGGSEAGREAGRERERGGTSRHFVRGGQQDIYIHLIVLSLRLELDESENYTVVRMKPECGL